MPTDPATTEQPAATDPAPDPDPSPDRPPSEPVDEPVAVETTPAPVPPPRRTDAVLRRVTTEAPERMLRTIRDYPAALPDWVPEEYAPGLAPIWESIVAAANALPEFLDETEIAPNQTVVVYRITTNTPQGTGAFIGIHRDAAIVVLTADGLPARYPLAEYAFAAPT